MTRKQLLDYIEDKKIDVNDDWLFHATDRDIHAVKQILCEGIKAACLRKEKSSQGYNGRYYISLSKKTSNPNSVYGLFEHFTMFVLEEINPIKANDANRIFDPFTETVFPFRTSSKPDEYHAFLKIPPSKIVALAYNLYYILGNEEFDINRFQFLKELVLLLDEMHKDLPIYDLSTKREINKEKVKNLNLGQFVQV